MGASAASLNTHTKTLLLLNLRRHSCSYLDGTVKTAVAYDGSLVAVVQDEVLPVLPVLFLTSLP